MKQVALAILLGLTMLGTSLATAKSYSGKNSAIEAQCSTTVQHKWNFPPR